MQGNWVKWKNIGKIQNKSKRSYGQIGCGWEEEPNEQKCVRHFLHRSQNWAFEVMVNESS